MRCALEVPEALTPLQKLANEDVEVYQIVEEKTFSQEKIVSSRETIQTVTCPSKTPLLRVPTTHSRAVEAYISRGTRSTPVADSVQGLCFVTSPSAEVPRTWLCGRCTERSTGDYCQNCGSGAVFLVSRTSVDDS